MVHLGDLEASERTIMGTESSSYARALRAKFVERSAWPRPTCIWPRRAVLSEVEGNRPQKWVGPGPVHRRNKGCAGETAVSRVCGL